MLSFFGRALMLALPIVCYGNSALADSSISINRSTNGMETYISISTKDIMGSRSCCHIWQLKSGLHFIGSHGTTFSIGNYKGNQNLIEEIQPLGCHAAQ